ncbi:MAG: hypothetical protein C4534_07110 [Gaiellales bacterium]|nr:MAG: hypothetical protein C4534_07110 [Gaiellales bacterium]
MSSHFERGILLTLGLAAVAREVAESLADELVRRGEDFSGEGRRAFDDAVEKAKDEARTLRDRFDSQVQRGYRDMGIASSDQLEDMRLKIAQLEHRVSLLEAAYEELAGEGELQPVAPDKAGG